MNASTGEIIAHRDMSLISTKLSESSDGFMQDVWTKIQADNYKIEEIGSNLAGISEIEGTDWILVSYIPKSIVYSDINMVRVAMIIICIISVLLITVLIERVVNAVISPVKGLTKIITDMTNGDFTIEVPTNKNWQWSL